MEHRVQSWQSSPTLHTWDLCSEQDEQGEQDSPPQSPLSSAPPAIPVDEFPNVLFDPGSYALAYPATLPLTRKLHAQLRAQLAGGEFTVCAATTLVGIGIVAPGGTVLAAGSGTPTESALRRALKESAVQNEARGEGSWEACGEEDRDTREGYRAALEEALRALRERPTYGASGSIDAAERGECRHTVDWGALSGLWQDVVDKPEEAVIDWLPQSFQGEKQTEEWQQAGPLLSVSWMQSLGVGAQSDW